MKLAFSKYEAAGNDFVAIDMTSSTTPGLTEEQLRRMCDRKKGIGADGVLILRWSEISKCRFKLLYYNADGREGSLCGNASRCSLAFAERIGLVDLGHVGLLSHVALTEARHVKWADTRDLELNREVHKALRGYHVGPSDEGQVGVKGQGHVRMAEEGHHELVGEDHVKSTGKTREGSTEISLLKWTIVTHVESTEEIHVGSTEENNVNSAEEIHVNSTEEIHVKSTEENNVKLTEESNVKSTEESNVKSTEESDVKSTEENDMASTEKNHVTSTKENHVGWTEENHVKSIQDSHMKSTEGNHVKSIQHSHMKSTEENHVISTEEDHVKSTEGNPVRSTVEVHVVSAENTHTRSLEENHVQFTTESLMGSAGENHVKWTQENDVESTLKGHARLTQEGGQGPPDHPATIEADHLGWPEVSHTIMFEACDGVHGGGKLSQNQFFIDIQDISLDDARRLDEDNVFLDTGSPHHIRFVSDVSDVDVVTLGRAMRWGLYAERGANINFVEVASPTEGARCLRVRTYERGVEDETLACGTGATAAAIAAFVREQVWTEDLQKCVDTQVLTHGSSSSENSFRCHSGNISTVTTGLDTTELSTITATTTATVLSSMLADSTSTNSNPRNTATTATTIRSYAATDTITTTTTTAQTTNASKTSATSSTTSSSSNTSSCSSPVRTQVTMGGGMLVVTFTLRGRIVQDIHLTGPATHVFDGTVLM